uniref:Uncharacterized protein n=1 Tax=Manihot esculenta TaxID=3983 RepID=A0A2C9UUZ3_MANES
MMMEMTTMTTRSRTKARLGVASTIRLRATFRFLKHLGPLKKKIKEEEEIRKERQ